MAIGFWQLLVIVYVLFIAIGPRRVVRWIRWTNETSARLRGKAPPPRRTVGWLRALELFEYSTQVGWACLAIGCALAMYALSIDAWTAWKMVLLGLATLLLFLGPWLI
jgi:hypothetical protein